MINIFDIHNFVDIKSEQFNEYTYPVCGLGLDINDIITSDNQYLFSTMKETFSITFHFNHFKFNPYNVHGDIKKL